MKVNKLLLLKSESIAERLSHVLDEVRELTFGKKTVSNRKLTPALNRAQVKLLGIANEKEEQ
jgi:hypothetical protein